MTNVQVAGNSQRMSLFFLCNDDASIMQQSEKIASNAPVIQSNDQLQAQYDASKHTNKNFCRTTSHSQVLSPTSVSVSQLSIFNSPIATLSLGNTEETSLYKRHTLPKRRPLTSSERGKLLRSRRKAQLDGLNNSVSTLTQQVRELKHARDVLRQNVLLNSVATADSCLKLVTEYYDLFRYGVPDHQNYDCIVIAMRQANFLRKICCPDMPYIDTKSGATLFGANALFQQWARYSRSHGFMNMKLNHIELSPSEAAPVICTSSVLTVRYTRATIENFYPHILWNSTDVMSLIGLEVEVPIDLRFTFNKNKQVEKFEANVEFIPGLVKALGDFERVMALVDEAVYQVRSSHMLPALNGPSSNEVQSIVPFEYLARYGTV